MGELVGVVAKPCHLAQQVGMVGAGARVEFSTQDQGTDITLTGQAAQIRLPVEVAQFSVVEPQRDLVLPLAPDGQRAASRSWRLGGVREMRWQGTFPKSSSAQSGR